MNILLRGLIGSAFAIGLFAVLFFGPTWLLTGGLDWPRGRELLVILTGAYLAGTLWMAWADPELLKERTSFTGKQPLADKFATTLLYLFILGWVVLVPVDLHALHLLPAPPAQLSYWGGLGLFVAGCLLIWRTMRANTFAATIVKEHEREQYVIDSGPYARVRHPMYASMILLFAGVGLFLESTALALAALPGVFVATLPRILIEEKTLKKDLPDYADYMTRVRWRLIPGVF